MKEIIAMTQALSSISQLAYFPFGNNGSPKQYGQWLQSNGRQKWSIKNKK